MLQAVGVKNFNKVKAGSKLKAYTDVLCELRDGGDAVFVIAGCKLIEGQNGLFVAMPSEKYTDKEGNIKYKNVVFINTKDDEDARELQKSINDVVIKEWNKMNKSSNSSSKKQPQTEGSFDNSNELPW